MSIQQTAYLLKVLSGSNAGALVRLNTGSVVIGKAMSSDIILYDEDVADAHLRLKVSADKLFITPLAQPVYVDNREIAAAEMLLKPYQVVTLGNVEFFVADTRKSADRESATQQATASASQAPVRAQPEVSGSSIPRVKNKPGFFSGGQRYLWGGLALLLIGNLIFFAPELKQLSEQIGLKASVSDKAESLVEQSDSPHLKTETLSDGTVAISGYVSSHAEKNDILRRVSNLGRGVTHRIWVQDDLLLNAEMIAHTLGQRDVAFASLDTPGELAAKGYVSSASEWTRIKENIMTDVAGIRVIDDKKVQTLVTRKAALEQFIDKKGLSSRIRVAIEEGQIKVSGELTKSELNRWGDLYQEFLELHGKGPAIVERLYDARERIRLAIRSVSVGKTPFIVAKDGKKYLEGSSLGESFYVKAIKPDHVLLSKNGIEIPIYYGVEDK